MTAMSALQDSFAVNDLASVWGNSFNSPVIGGGRAALPCISAYSGLGSTSNYDLTGSYAFLCAQPYRPLATGQMFLRLQASTGNYIQIGFDGGALDSAIVQGGTQTNGTSVTYNPVDHAWWRIRQASSTLYCDYAPDGATWTNLWSTSYSFAVTAMQAQVISGHYGGTSGTLTNLENVNSGPYVIQCNEYDSAAALDVGYTTGSPYGLDVTSSSVNNTHPGSPAAYPSIYVGNQWGNLSQGNPFPLRVSALTTGQVVTTCAATLGAGGTDIWDYVYDNWFNQDTDSTDNATNGLEHMIWMNNSSGVVPPGSLYASGVTIGGNTFDVYWQGPWANASQGTASFQFTSGQTGATIDMAEHAAYMVAQGWLPSSWYLINVQAGFELWKGGSGLDLTSFTVSNADGTSYAEDFNLAPTASFPATVLDVGVDLQLGGVWTDITGDVLQREGTSPPITISRGRPDESAQVNPAALAMQLNNRAGTYSVLNPAGPYYGLLGRNTPVRVSVPAETTYLRMADDTTSYASTPSSSGLNVAGDLEVQIDTQLDGWTASSTAIALISKWATSELSWYIELQTDGCVLFWMSPNGSTTYNVASTMPLPPGRVALKVTYAHSSGTVTFYTAPTISGSWTELGTAGTTASGGGTIYGSTAAVSIGYTAGSVTGRIFAVNILSGIGGTAEASPDFTTAVPGAPSLTDAQGNVWTLNGTAEFTGRDYRFHGEMSSLPIAWDLSGTDVWVPVAGAGILRRLGQGSAPLDSALKRAILSRTGALAPAAYWPCEDLQGSTAIGSAIGGPLMQISGGTGDGSVTTTGPAFAADSSFLCSAALPTLNGSEWAGQVPAYSSSGAIVVRFPLKLGTAPAATATLFRVITSGTLGEFSLQVTSGGYFILAGYDSSGTVFASESITSPTGGSYSGLQQWVSMELTSGGGSTVDAALITLEPGGASAYGTTYGTFSGTIGNVLAVYVNPFGTFTDTVIGHISVQGDWETMYDLQQPLDAWQGELAGERFLRLCGENTLTGRVYGAPDVTVAMGAQAPEALTTLLQEIEDADHGQLYEPRQALGLGYRTQASMLNQEPAVTISYSAAELGGADVSPTYDDQYTRNDITAQRSSGNVSGASYRYQLDDGTAMSISPPPDGVGDYSNSSSVNVEADSQLPDQAGWLVHLGTVNEARWPSLPVNMVRPAASGIFWDVQGADIGDYVQLSSPPAWLPPDTVRQLAYGLKESIGGFHYQAEINAVPESPYETGLYDDTTYGRADTDGSTLAAGVSTTATTLSVATTNATSPLWTTVSSDVPFDIGLTGEQMTVTAVTGDSSPQSFTVTRSVNGVTKAHVAGEDIRLWTPPVYAML